MEKVYKGLAGPAAGPLSDHAAGFDPTQRPYIQQRRADACLAEAGRPQLTWEERVQEHKRCAGIIASDAPWLWIAQPGFQVSTRSDVTGINWYAGEAVDWSKVEYAS